MENDDFAHEELVHIKNNFGAKDSLSDIERILVLNVSIVKSVIENGRKIADTLPITHLLILVSRHSPQWLLKQNTEID